MVQRFRDNWSPFGKMLPGGSVIFERIAPMETVSEKVSPLENVVVFIIFFAIILGFCGGVIAVWMMR